MKTNFNFEEEGPSLALGELELGEAAMVLDVGIDGALGRRLLDLGFLPGTVVARVRRAPLGDPSVYELRGYQLCLRQSEASLIRVRRIAAESRVEETAP